MIVNSMKLYTLTQLSKLAGVTRQRVYQWIKEGKIETTDIDGFHIFVDEVDIPIFIRERKNEKK